ncbi:MAG: LemA family protein [Nitrospirae bacterium]|nr:LemA family protein [Nitrospirota bacterium]
MIVVWISAGLVFLLSVLGICIYNRLVTLRNDVRNAWSQIDVQLKRRYDLIPNLVAAVRGYMAHEKQVLENVVAARALTLSATKVKERAAAEDGLSLELKGLFAVMEAYPDLKANQNIMLLQEELVSTENRIAFARQLYNDLVANYRTRLEVFPDIVIASVFSFRAAEYFAAGSDDTQLPKAVLSSSA